MLWKRCLTGAVAAVMLLSLAGCVDQNPDPVEDPASDTATTTEEQPRLVATSGSAVAICDLLELDLVGCSTSSIEYYPRYANATGVGGAMAPDMEIIASLHPTDVLGPDTLESALADSYEAAGIPATFLNLRSVQGLYDSITELGEKYGRQEQAAAAVEEYEETVAELEKLRGDQEGPLVLVLMGFPGAYCEATDLSYIGSMVAMAGGVNVVQADEEFVYWNSEELAKLDPDYILWTCHALREQTEKMFQEEFATNDIWSHFTAVQEGRIFAMDPSIFNMSATFDWPEGLEWLYNLFYGDGAETETPTQIGSGEAAQ